MEILEKMKIFKKNNLEGKKKKENLRKLVRNANTHRNKPQNRVEKTKKDPKENWRKTRTKPCIWPGLACH